MPLSVRSLTNSPRTCFSKKGAAKRSNQEIQSAGGLQSIIDAVAADPAIETVAGKEVKDIEFAANAFKVTATDAAP